MSQHDRGNQGLGDRSLGLEAEKKVGRVPEQPGSSPEFRPSDFMRARRPYLFSDSETVSEPRLSREVLDYHLETLTSRKQEIEFEHFCRRLAEKEICRNLLPQSGPTGGGDSKVDAETYPVAEAISIRWYEGNAKESGQERWAFAFSAKQDWASKVAADVQGIAETKRPYTLIYFITNQYVPDKKRARTEDQLSKLHEIPVRILDRNWILTRVFQNKREQLAIETLGLTGSSAESRRAVGPKDTEREAELEELDKQIDNPARYEGLDYQLAEDCLSSALLSRGLERPRHEVEGRFERAQRVAQKVNHPHQLLRIVYARAWTTFWWYNDFSEFNRQYEDVERLCEGTTNASDLELLTNLWQVLVATVRRGQLDVTTSEVEARTKKLKDALDHSASDMERPNNAFWARSERVLIDLTEAMAADADLTPILGELGRVLMASEGLGTFPLEPLDEIIRELGSVLPDNKAYDELFETLVALVERRTSEAEAGRALLRRGYQKLEASRRYEAIRLLGRAQVKLIKRECREELVSALMGCGLAYEGAGLLWAARMNVLAAAGNALSDFWEHGTIVRPVLPCLQKLIWIEMQLGRVPHLLGLIEIAKAVAGHLRLEGEQKQRHEKHFELQDKILGILLLSAPIKTLETLSFLPGILARLQLPHSEMALLYALGYERKLRDDGWIPAEETDDSVKDFFNKWRSQPAKDDVPSEPELLQGSEIVLRSAVLGCEVLVTAENNLTSIQLAETILGVLEAFLATGLDERVFPYRSRLSLEVRPTEEHIEGPQYRIASVKGEPTVEIKHPVPLIHGTLEARHSFRQWLLEVASHVLTQVAVISDADTFLNNLVSGEAGIQRALEFSDVAINIHNIFGDNPKLRLADWEHDAPPERFPLQRGQPWNEGLVAESGSEFESLWSRPGEGDPPKELFDIDALKHSDRRVFSVIDIGLWDKGKWRATAYLYSLHSDVPPIMALGFEDSEAARSIFEAWRGRFGDTDGNEEIRVSIITGVDQKNPSSYSVVVGVNPRVKKGELSGGQIVTIARINRMEPADLRNLNGFLKQYGRAGSFLLAPAHFVDASTPPKFFTELAVKKKEVIVREAWQVGEHDPDSCALQADDSPIIPSGVTDAPVLRAMERIRQRRRN